MGHEEIRELLAGYALGATDADESAAVAAHLERGCPSCENELRQWSGVVARLPEAAPAVEPSEMSRARVLAATGEPPPPAVAQPPRRPRRWALALAAALLIAVGLLGAVQLRRLGVEVEALARDLDAARSRVTQTQAELSRTRTELVRLRMAVAVAGNPLTETVRLAGLEAAPEASGRTLVDPGDRRAAFFAGGLAPAPEGSTYQLWLIVDGTPRSGGVFDVGEGGRAMLIVEGVAPPETIDAWAVTIEPAGGVPLPTGEMVLLG